MSLWEALAPSLVAAAAGLVGAYIGGAIARRNESRRQRLEFATQQLREFYAPLLALRKRILTLSELRVKAMNAAEPEHYPDWGREPTSVQEHFSQREEHQGRLDDLKKVLAFYDNQFKTELLPLYEQMESIFRERMHLANPETQKHYAALVEYVELWKRHFADDLPQRVIVNIGITETVLHPLYTDLSKQFERLQLRLRKADPDAEPPIW